MCVCVCVGQESILLVVPLISLLFEAGAGVFHWDMECTDRLNPAGQEVPRFCLSPPC